MDPPPLTVTARDAKLVAGNIKEGVQIFGVTGTHGPCSCSGTLSEQGRWCDNGDGTVTDLLGSTVDGKTTGRCLVWLKKADWGGSKQWVSSTNDDAHTRAGILKAGAAGANLSDNSVEGDWRLPTIRELKALGKTITADFPGPFLNVVGDDYAGNVEKFYWSSTSGTDSPQNAWIFSFSSNPSQYGHKQQFHYVWPVRGGL